jgi:hypothetical protein
MTLPEGGEGRARNAFIPFADPAITGGLLIELFQYPREGEGISD